MAKKYFYAVAIGKQTGVFRSWEECESLVKGFKGAQFKGFGYQQRAEAQEWVDAHKKESSRQVSYKEPVGVDKSGIEVYTDGSFQRGAASWAFVVYRDGVEIANDSGLCDEAGNSLHNIAGELKAVSKAILYCRNNGLTRFIIYHDYTGVSKWLTGVWRTKNPLVASWKEVTVKYMHNLRVNFQHIPGHAGNKGNERADRLAAEVHNR